MSLKTTYETTILPQLREEGGYRNVMQVPRLQKVVVNSGFKGTVDHDTITFVRDTLGQITGQRPVVTKATKSISNFKLREHMPIGVKVTLRGARMYDFLERLIHTALPRIRDFRGVSPRGFDGRGNYTMGLKDQTVFPELDPSKQKTTFGMDICMVTSAGTNAEARKLLDKLGMPFARPAGT